MQLITGGANLCYKLEDNEVIWLLKMIKMGRQLDEHAKVWACQKDQDWHFYKGSLVHARNQDIKGLASRM